MCVAVVCKPGHEMKREDFNAAWETNPDGGGLAFYHPKGLVVQKTMDKEALWNLLQAANHYRTSDLLLHFRIKTHGTKDVDNCHPFRVHYKYHELMQEEDALSQLAAEVDLAVIHNGIFSSVETHATKSDTAMFCSQILEPLPAGWWHYPSCLRIIEDYVRASSSKLAILPPDGNAIIFNEDAGTWKEDGSVWYSNCYFFHRTSWPSRYSSKPWHADESIWEVLVKTFKGNKEKVVM